MEILISLLLGWFGLTFLIVGLIGMLVTWLFSKIPFITTYRLQVQVISVILFTLGVFAQGVSWKQDQYEMQLADAKIQVAIAEAKAAEVTTEVITEYVDRVQIVKEKGDVIIKEVPEYIVKYDSRCELPNAFVELHDSAAQNKIPDSTRLADEGTSDIKLSGATETIVENYGTCHQIREQLKSLQDWIRKQEKVSKDGN